MAPTSPEASSAPAASELPSPVKRIPMPSSDDDHVDDASVDPLLPEELRRHLQEQLEQQGLRSLHVPYEVVWAIGIGGALVSAAVSLSPWPCFVYHRIRRRPGGALQPARQRAASLPEVLSSSPQRAPVPRRTSTSSIPSSSSSSARSRSQSPTSPSSATSFDSAVGGLHSILHASSAHGGRRKPVRHVSFRLSETQEESASLSDGDEKHPVNEDPPTLEEGGTDGLSAVEVEPSAQNEAKSHRKRHKWCPVCSSIARKLSSSQASPSP